MHWAYLRARALGVVFLAGCASLQLTPIKSAQQRPSNVAVYFKVRTSGGDPVGGLGSESFRIFEDGQLVSQYESKQTILNPEVAAVHYTLLLVDMSGSVSESGNGEVVAQAVGAFAERVEKQERVGIYAFDGSPSLYPIVGFTDQVGSAKAGVRQLATFKPRDPSTNLNGAIVRALDELDAALGRASQPLKFGTLVVFTDGTDRANRVSSADMRKHIRDRPFDVFAIGLGAEIKESELEDIGKSGTAMAADRNAVVKAFDEVGAKVEGRTKSFYLLSYCSPSRAGTHEVRVQATYKDGKGSERAGDLEARFDATGFAPGCDPNAPPSFDVTKGDALAPPPERESKRDEKRDKKAEHEEKREAKKEIRGASRPASPPPTKIPPPPPPAVSDSAAPESAESPVSAPKSDFNP